MATKTSPFNWTNDEVELPLKLTNEYKVKNENKNIDWGSVQQKCTDILDRFKSELEKAIEWLGKGLSSQGGINLQAVLSTEHGKKQLLSCLRIFKTTRFNQNYS